MQSNTLLLRGRCIFYVAALFLLAIAVTTRPASANLSSHAGSTPGRASDCDPGWSIVPSGNVDFDDNTLFAVASTAADDAWAVGNYVVTI